MSRSFLLGQRLRRDGRISAAELERAVQSQERSLRPLGEILVAQGAVQAAVLDRAVTAQRTTMEMADPATGRPRRELLFGEIAVEGGWLKAEELHEALRVQAGGTPVRLGDWCRERGWLDDDAVREILREQDRRAIRRVVACRSCGTAHEATQASPEAAHRCRKCKRPLALPAALFGDAPAARPGSERLPAVRYLGPYEIQDELARGGMGVVYRARHRTLGRQVALKVLSAGPGISADLVRRFKREARAVARLQHPGIVPVYDVGVQGDRHYFAMELIAGETFDLWLRRVRPVPAAIATVLAGVAEALAHAHSRGIIHRDVKPGNILVDPQGRPHITDFGLAVDVQADARLTGSGIALGTPSYMSPEQARGEADAVDGRSDVFALGAVAYEALCGHGPFEGASVMDTLLKVVQDEPAPLRDRAPHVSVDLELVVTKALEKDAWARYADASAMAADLRHVARGEPVSLRRPNAWQRGVRRLRHEPALALATAATLLLASGIGVGALCASALVR